MKISTFYPYPVLYENNDDYVNSSFNTKLEVNESFGEVAVRAFFDLNDEVIETLISSGACSFAIHIECGQTSYRDLSTTTREVLEIQIPGDQLRGKIEIHSFVIANHAIKDYRNPNLNDWYKDMPLRFEKGNILAIGNAIEMTLFEDDKELLNLPSIVKVTQSEKNEFMEVDMTQDLLIVSLPKYEYEQYVYNRKSILKQTILSNVFVPALVEVFSKIRDAYDFEDTTWYQVMEKIFAENNVSINEVGTDKLPALKAAQMVLRKPLKTSFEEIEGFNKEREK